MDRKEAINILSLRRQNAVGTLGNLPREANYTAKNVLVDEISAYDMAIEALQEQERRWIPVSERLPDVTGNYLVISKGSTWVANWFNGTWWGIEKKCRWTDVEAWQPLPEPYKESEK